jgi:hypothetical protein
MVPVRHDAPMCCATGSSWCSSVRWRCPGWATCLQDAGIKIDWVASSLTTRSGANQGDGRGLIDGERCPTALADLAKGKTGSKIPDLGWALEGRFDSHHALMCQLHRSSSTSWTNWTR